MGDLNKNVPRLRFPGYTDAWVKCKLGDVGKTFTGLSGKTKEDFGHGEGKFVTYINVFKNPISDLNELENVEIDDNQAQVNYGDVLFTTSSETPDEVGMSSVWLGKQDNIYLNSFCFGYRPQLVFDYIYLAFMLRSPSIRNHFMLLAQGISRYNISKNKAMEISVPIPELNEQTKIGEFFKHLDDLITVNERELNKLKDLKKSYLEKMFPKNGSDIPELRFPGYADAWVKCELGDVVKKIKSYSLSRDVETDKHTGYKYIHYGDIHTNVAGYIDEESILPNIKADDFDILDAGDLIVADASEDYQGIAKPAVLVVKPTSNVVAGLHTIALRPTHSNSIFLYYLLQTDLFKQFGKKAGTGMKVFGITFSNLSKFHTSFPTEDEQHKIGKFLHSIDDLITVNEHKLFNSILSS